MKNKKRKASHRLVKMIGRLRLSGREGLVVDETTGQIIKIDQTDLNTGLHGDLVEVVIIKKSKTKNESMVGQISRIVKRAKIRFVGGVGKIGNRYYVFPDDKKMYANIVIPSSEAKTLPAKEKVLTEIIDWNNPQKSPVGRIIERLGQTGAHETEMRAIILDRGFADEFTPTVMAEADRLEKNFTAELKKEAASRRDFRSVLTFTVDPETAKDFDDALSIQSSGNDRFEVGVHIADVSHYVKPDTELDREAARRGTSVYLVDRTISMLPEALSNNICSLIPNQDRLAFSAVFELDKSGHIQSEWYGKTIINSRRRFSYQEAQAVLDGQSQEYAAELKILNNLAGKLRKQKIEAGALIFEDTEVTVELDEAGRPIAIATKERTEAHRLIEDFMLLANRQVAAYASRLNKNRDHTFVYRVHDLPDMEKLAELQTFLRPFGFDLKIKDNHVSQKELNRLLKKVAKTPQGPIVHRAAIRAMAKAVYTTQNIGHWGLAFQYYTHFTSPIRRYPDLMVHRLMTDYLAGRRPNQTTLNHLAREVLHSTDMEIKAAEAERESIKLKQVEFMAGKIGQTLEGIISGITKWGIFVEEEKTKADGLILTENLGNDYFELDEKNYRLIGRNTGLIYRLGDKLKFKITGADPIRKTLDYVPV